MLRKILVTGPPGCGKTTVVRKVAGLLGGKARGFYTEEIRDATRQRIGFRVVTLDGKRGEHADKSPGPGPRVGSYRVNLESFDRVALPSMRGKERGILVIDEIGKMECCSEAFARRVRRRSDARTFLVTPGNREAIPAEIAAALSALADGERG